jgi:nucleotide-binding universal stress UspA family protein
MKILVAFDGSDEAGKALKWASDLAKGMGLAGVTVIAVARSLEATPAIADAVDPSSDLPTHRTQLEQAKATIGGEGVKAETMLRAGNPAEEILDAAEAGGFDLIVVGHRGMGAARRFLMGSVSERVVRHAKCPVLVVH